MLSASQRAAPLLCCRVCYAVPVQAAQHHLTQFGACQVVPVLWLVVRYLSCLVCLVACTLHEAYASQWQHRSTTSSLASPSGKPPTIELAPSSSQVPCATPTTQAQQRKCSTRPTDAHGPCSPAQTAHTHHRTGRYACAPIQTGPGKMESKLMTQPHIGLRRIHSTLFGLVSCQQQHPAP